MYATMMTFNRWSAKNIIEDLCDEYECTFRIQYIDRDCDLKWTIYGERAKMVVKNASRYYWFLGEE